MAVVMAHEYGKMFELLQETFNELRRKELELEAAQLKLKSKDTEVEGLKTQLLLTQMLLHGALPQPEKKDDDDEYTV